MVNMATAQNSNNTLLISEILDKAHKAKTKARKIEILQQHDSDSLRMILKASFDTKCLSFSFAILLHSKPLSGHLLTASNFFVILLNSFIVS